MQQPIIFDLSQTRGVLLKQNKMCLNYFKPDYKLGLPFRTGERELMFGFILPQNTLKEGLVEEIYPFRFAYRAQRCPI
jgi:hypothetical protein